MHTDDSNQEGQNEDSGDNERVGFTIPSEPPERERPQRRSWWSDVFAEVRECPGQWRLVLMGFSKSTAHQVASDIRNSWRRAPEKMRLRGIHAGEFWDADCALAPLVGVGERPVPERYVLWVRYLGTDDVEVA